MKSVERYRHEDGRTVDLCKTSDDEFELWQIYPEKDLMVGSLSKDEAESKVQELGFAANPGSFSPPCPRCQKDCTMAVDSGFYHCPDCNTNY